MPIFEFDCLECEKQFERLVGVGAGNNGKPACPVCGSANVKKKFSKFAMASKSGTGTGNAVSTGSGCSSCSSSSCSTCH